MYVGDGVFRYGGEIMGIKEVNTSSIDVVIFPNPVNSILSVQVSHTSEQDLSTRIFSFDGRLVGNYKIRSNIYDIDVSSLSSGLYILTISDGDGGIITTRKFIKY